MNFPIIPTETRQHYLLRIAAEIISTHAPDISLNWDDEDGTGSEFAELLRQENEAIDAAQRAEQKSTVIHATLIQAGETEPGHPTLTFTTTRDQFSKSPPLPFYQKARLTIHPF